MTIDIFQPTPSAIAEAAERLRQGRLVAMPTETVYGLAADASSKLAVQKIFEAKERPNDHPLIVHIPSPSPDLPVWTELDWLEILSKWAREIPPPAIALAMAAWPGPLTMILPRAKDVNDEVTGGQDTVGIRCPDHPVAQALLNEFQGGVAAPSANRFGRISPTTADHVADEFAQQTDLLILDGGSCEVGIESTIVDLCHWDTNGPVILRPGVITGAQIAKWTGLEIGKKPAQNIRFSGGLSAHYAPRTQLLLNKDKEFPEKTIRGLVGKIAWVEQDAPCFLASPEQIIEFHQFPKDPLAAAKVLYSLLRDLDHQKYNYLVFPDLPEDAEWAGVKDRLQRAAVGSGF